MYAIRSYYVRPRLWPHDDVQPRQRGLGDLDRIVEPRALQRTIEDVITSYSIHYTKLYDHSTEHGNKATVNRLDRLSIGYVSERNNFV